MLAYSDSNHSGDKSNFISVNGSMIMYGGGPTFWKSKKSEVYQSSTEAELLAFLQTTNLVVQMRRLPPGYNGPIPPPVKRWYCVKLRPGS